MPLFPGYYGSNQNSANALNNAINSLRQNQPQQQQQSALNPGMNRPHRHRGSAFLNQSAPPTVNTPIGPTPVTAVQAYHPRVVSGGTPAIARAATPAAVPTATPTVATPTAAAPVAPIANPVRIPVTGAPQAPPVVPATGPYGPVAGIPYVRQY